MLFRPCRCIIKLNTTSRPTKGSYDDVLSDISVTFTIWCHLHEWSLAASSCDDATVDAIKSIQFNWVFSSLDQGFMIAVPVMI